MNFIEALKNVNKSHPHYCDFEDLCNEFNIISDYSYSDEFDNRVKSYFLIEWLCTDSLVGACAIYFDDELIGYYHQFARKADKTYYFISEEKADNLRKFMLSLIEEKINYEIINENEVISEYYTVEYSDQIITKIGFVNGKRCEVVKKCNYTELEVIYDNGVKEKISTKDFLIPININK
jgi:hypothetical protein